MVEQLEKAGEKLEAAMQNNVSQSLALIYGLAMMTWSAFNQMNSNYWSYFLTDICGMEPTTMGAVKSVSAGLAWIFVIVSATIVEKVWLRHGAYRSWFAIAPAAAGICLFMTWLNPINIIGVEATMVWMTFFYTAGQFCVNFFQIAAAAIVPAISHTQADSALMSTRKAQGNMLVKVLFAMVSLPVILMLNSVIYGVSYDDGKGAGPAGFIIFAAFLVIVMIVLYGVFYKKLDGMDPTEPICQARYEAKKRGEKLEALPTSKKTDEQVTLFEMIKFWITNVPALAGLVCEVGRFIAQTLVQGLAIYVFQYVYGNVTMSAVFMTIVNVVGLVATFIADPMSKKFGIRITYLTGIGIAALSMILCYFIGAMNMYVFIACVSGCFFGMNFQNACMIGMQSCAVRYGEWRDGKTARAFITSTFQWSPQISNMITGVVMGAGLASIGFVKGMDPNPELAQGFITIISFLPAIVMGIGFVCFFFLYPLNNKKMAQINADLEARKAEKAAAEPAAEADQQ